MDKKDFFEEVGNIRKKVNSNPSRSRLRFSSQGTDFKDQQEYLKNKELGNNAKRSSKKNPIDKALAEYDNNLPATPKLDRLLEIFDEDDDFDGEDIDDSPFFDEQ